MIKYRKNKSWGTKTFSVDSYIEIDAAIEKHSKYIQGNYKLKDIDIVDININSHETRYSGPEYIITIFYAIVDTDDKRTEI